MSRNTDPVVHCNVRRYAAHIGYPPDEEMAADIADRLQYSKFVIVPCSGGKLVIVHFAAGVKAEHIHKAMSILRTFSACEKAVFVTDKRASELNLKEALPKRVKKYRVYPPYKFSRPGPAKNVRHEIAAPAEVEAVLRQFQIEKRHMRRLDLSDTEVIWIGLAVEAGDVIKITRADSVAYAVVKHGK